MKGKEKVRQQKGFTLLDLLLVMATLALIAAIAVPSILRVKTIDDFRVSFGVQLGSVELQPDEIAVLRPFVVTRIAQLDAEYQKALNEYMEVCNKSAPKTPKEAEERLRGIAATRLFKEATWEKARDARITARHIPGLLPAEEAK